MSLNAAADHPCVDCRRSLLAYCAGTRRGSNQFSLPRFCSVLVEVAEETAPWSGARSWVLSLSPYARGDGVAGQGCPASTMMCGKLDNA